MAAFADVQQREFAAEDRGFTATKHQRQVGAGYFDDVAEAISGGTVSTGALTGSTEESQF
jgi:isocitrate/methylisocitrate lyase